MKKIIFIELKWNRIFVFILSFILFIRCGGSDDPKPETSGILVETIVTSGTYKGDDGLSVDSKGSIYVSNLASGSGSAIYKVAQNGTSTPFATGLPAPMGHAFDISDNLFVAFSKSTKISMINPEGDVTDYLVDNRFKGGSLVVDTDGTIYHSVFATNTVYKITPDKEVVEIAKGGSLNVPFGITMDDNKNIYVANFSDGIVTRITASGEVSSLADVPSRIGYITYENNKLYATGFSSHDIYAIELDGTFSVLIGAGKSGNDDGQGSQVTFASPNGVAFLSDGKTLYISQKNFKIRKILLE